jgi:hypothetical protein
MALPAAVFYCTGVAMKLPIKKLVPFVLILGLAASSVWADEIILTHRSGKVRVIPVETHDDPVEQVSFRRTGTSGTPEKQLVQPDTTMTTPAKETRPLQEKTVPRTGNDSKPPFKMRWAPPMDAQ